MKCIKCNEDAEYSEKTFVTVDGKSYNYIRCKICSQSIGFEIDHTWCSLNDVLKSDSKKTGVFPAISTGDKLAHYILRQFMFNENEQTENKCQLKFDTPDDQDLIMLFWLNGTAIGFYTLKLKGTWIEDVDDVYTITVLDTVFIDKHYRRKGYGQKILKHICDSYPHEDIGISKPISPEMQAALRKFLLDHPNHRNRLWEIDGTGGEGYRKLIWFVLAKGKTITSTNNVNPMSSLHQNSA